MLNVYQAGLTIDSKMSANISQKYMSGFLKASTSKRFSGGRPNTSLSIRYLHKYRSWKYPLSGVWGVNLACLTKIYVISLLNHPFSKFSLYKIFLKKKPMLIQKLDFLVKLPTTFPPTSLIALRYQLPRQYNG